jgi:glycosyltransferase involved in cell wall biosynthesis
MKLILLITHDTSLSGAPKSVLLVFEELKKRGYSFITVALRGGGKLEPRFIALSEQYYRLDTISKEPSYTLFNRIKRKFLKKPILSPYEDFIRLLTQSTFQYVYANTVLSLDFSLELKRKLQCPIVLHVHELKTVIEEFQPALHSFDQEIDLYLVPSTLNQMCLEKEYGLPLSKIKILREASSFIPIKEKEVLKNKTDKTKVLMCGGAYWRKGDDLFIQLAKLVLKKDPNFHFYWVGSQSMERKRVNLSDLEKLGIQESVFFIEETETPEKWYIEADFFALTSREDPFPLAAIEAGLLGLPIVCFEKATGISEVISSDCVVSYLDLEAMSEQIIRLKQQPTRVKEISEENQQEFKRFTPVIISEELHQILEGLYVA